MIRKVLKIIKPQTVLEGAGVPIKRIIPSPDIEFDLVDPFLLLDEVNLPSNVDEAFPEHPHRGFEIITYMLSGASFHQDNQGNTEEFNKGDVQKITTGSGIYHGEGPVKGKPFHALQLWVNLRKADKLITPDYQIVKAESFPNKFIDNAEVKFIAGDEAPINLKNPITYLDINLKGKFNYQIPQDYNCLIYNLEGEVTIEDKSINANELSVLSHGDHLKLYSNHSRLILLAGEPLNEEVIWAGPFVD